MVKGNKSVNWLCRKIEAALSAQAAPKVPECEDCAMRAAGFISEEEHDRFVEALREAKAQAVPEGWKLLKDTTPAERSWPEDSSHENGNYSNTCVECGRTFIGHKRRAVCKVCAAAPQPPAPSEQPAFAAMSEGGERA